MTESKGVRIDTYLRERGPVPPAKAARIASEILDRIEAGAAAGDLRGLTGLSPARFLVSPGGRVSLLDPEGDLPEGGVPAYTSPEEIGGSRPDARSAIYSLGCALFEMLTGRPPYHGDDPAEIIRSHLEAPVPDLRSTRPDASPALATTVAKFLAKSPDERFSSPAEAREGLRSAFAPGAPAGAAAAPAPAPIPMPIVPPPSIPAVDDTIEMVDLEEFESFDDLPASAPEPAGETQSRRGGPVGRPPAVKRLPPRAPGGRPGPLGRKPMPSRPAAPPLGRPVASKSSPAVRGAAPRRAAGPAAYADEGWSMAPPAKKPWIFTWCGLAGGFLICVIIFLAGSGGSRPTGEEGMSKEEKDRIAERRAKWKSGVDGENNLAAAEFERVVRQGRLVGLEERADNLMKLLDRFPGSTSAREIADQVSNLRTATAEKAANDAAAKAHVPTERSALDEAPAGGDSGGEPAVGQAAGDGGSSSGSAVKTDREIEAERTDGIGGDHGGEDGKGDL